MLILTAGEFGKAVGRRLSESHGARCADLAEGCARLPALLDGEEFVGVATWRPYPQLCREIDDACFAHGMRWSMVELAGDTLTCGPLVAPGQGACHHCYLRRAASFRRAPERETALRACFDADPALGVQGFPAALVMIGAAALAEDAADGAPAARVRSVDVLTSSVRESEVIGVHRCPRCRARAPGFDPTSRSSAALVPSLEELLDA